MTLREAVTNLMGLPGARMRREQWSDEDWVILGHVSLPSEFDAVFIWQDRDYGPVDFTAEDVLTDDWVVITPEATG
jgi:hypothetical protein